MYITIRPDFKGIETRIVFFSNHLKCCITIRPDFKGIETIKYIFHYLILLLQLDPISRGLRLTADL